MTFWQRRRLVLLLAAAPAVAFILLQLWPLGYAAYDALTDTSGAYTTDHVERVWSDRLFQRSLGYSLLIPIVSVALEGVVGLAMALLFYELRRGKGFWRTVAILPFAMPEIVYLLTMKLVFRQHGYLNALLAASPAEPLGWLDPGSLLMVLVIIFVDAWRVTPIVFLIVLAHLEQLPTSYVEAARIDGATRWQVARHVLIPLALPALLVALALRAVDAFRIFATPLILVGVEALPVLTSVAYHYKADARDPAAANVAALTLAAVLMVLTTLTLFLARNKGRAR